MDVLAYIYDSRASSDTVAAVLARLRDRGEAIEYTDLGTADDVSAARRDALLTIGEATRIGSKPDELFDDDGEPDLSPGVLLTEAATGRRELHIGDEALDALRDDGETTG
jgi:hypothetical protein